MELELDFYADWIEVLRRGLLDAEYRIPQDATPEHISFMYFNVRRRAIDQQARTVVFSQTFSCPEKHKATLDAIAGVAQRGENLNPHLSKLLLDAKYNDLLLNDWGIHHFHLGPKLATSKFSERSGDLLFARVTDDAIYMIDVMTHESFDNLRLVETLVRSWPHLAEPYLLRGVIGLSQSVTEADRKVLRRKHANVPLEIDGAVYGPLGGGLSASGLSVRVVMAADMYHDWIDGLEAHVRASSEQIVNELERRGHSVKGRVRLRFALVGDTAFAVHEASRIQFNLGTLEPARPTSMVEL